MEELVEGLAGGNGCCSGFHPARVPRFVYWCYRYWLADLSVLDEPQGGIGRSRGNHVV